MTIASLFNIIGPNDQDALNVFTFANQDQHRIVSAAIFASKGIQVTPYPIDPVVMSDLGVFFYVHQAWHNEINQILGTSGFDLTDVDFNIPEQAASFARLHGQEHLTWQRVLGTPG